MNEFVLQLSEPSVIVQATKTFSQIGWGPYQFPKLLTTVKGDIYARWSMDNDTSDPLAQEFLEGQSCAVSEDGGQTWRIATPEDVPVSKIKLKDGSVFLQFDVPDNIPTPDWLTKYQKVNRSEARDMYFADDIPEYDRSVTYRVLLPDGTVQQRAATVQWPHMPVVYEPIYGHCVYSLGRMFSLANHVGIIQKDGVLYLSMYHFGFDSSAATREAAVVDFCDSYSVFVFASEDDGATWHYLSQHTATQEVYEARTPNAPFEGFDEPKMEIMPDGSVVMLMRTGRGQPCYITRSTDNCKSWSKPAKFDTVGVFPQLLTLGCGVTLSSYGRPGLFVRATDDPQGLIWQEHIEIPLPSNTDTGTHKPSVSGDAHVRDLSCCYTYLYPIDDRTALLAYSECHRPNAAGEPRKSVVYRTVTVV